MKIAICVLRWNEPENYYKLLCDALKVPEIHPYLVKRLNAKTQAKIKENTRRRTPEYHKKRAEYRKNKKRDTAPPSKDGHTDDKHPEIEQYQTKKDVRRTQPSTMLRGIKGEKKMIIS